MSKTRFIYTIQKSPLQYYIGSATLNSMPTEFYGLSSSSDFLPDIVKASKYPVQIIAFFNDSKSLKASLKAIIEEYTIRGYDLKTSTQEHKDKISMSLKNKWNDTNYVKKQESLRSDPIYRDKLSTARKSMYENNGQDICIAMSNLVNSRWSDDSKRINQSLKLKQRWQDPEFRNKVLESRKKA